MGVLRKLWSAWKVFALWLGRVQTAVLLSLVYHVALGPTGLAARALRRDLLGLRPADASASYWVEIPRAAHSIDQAEKQY